ncbi:hypothetical protein [Massilia sp. YMA4]|uniref:hypothetical protein n=1 Tax=Massilia sp. YMA4 TaxID=1593482 RepID=UPI000DD1853A|nr:hypothetical protein [Massilia sp. YMA4]AXA94272.1 hypothetical protein DPH57_25935 [Massilia sp. YMA4]
MKKLFLTGVIVMNTTFAQPMFQMPDQHTLELSSTMATGIADTLQRFRATQQPLENFTVVIEEGDDKDVLLISFVAKLKAGKKGLGSSNSMGRGITYRIRRDNGQVLGESFHR